MIQPPGQLEEQVSAIDPKGQPSVEYQLEVGRWDIPFGVIGVHRQFSRYLSVRAVIFLSVR